MESKESEQKRRERERRALAERTGRLRLVLLQKCQSCNQHYIYGLIHVASYHRMMQQTASIRHTLRVRLRSAIKSIRAVTSPWGPRLLSFLIRSVSGQMLSLTVLIFRQDCIDSSLARLKLEGLQLVESNLQKWTSKRKETPKMQLVLERVGKILPPVRFALPFLHILAFKIVRIVVVYHGICVLSLSLCLDH